MRNIRFVPGVLIITIYLYMIAPVQAQVDATNCQNIQARKDSIGEQGLTVKDRWLVQLRYRDASGGSTCYFDDDTVFRCDAFASIGFCEEGYDLKLNLPNMVYDHGYPEYFGDEKIDAPLHFAMMIGAQFVGSVAERDTRSQAR